MELPQEIPDVEMQIFIKELQLAGTGVLVGDEYILFVNPTKPDYCLTRGYRLKEGVWTLSSDHEDIANDWSGPPKTDTCNNDCPLYDKCPSNQ
jgi:hypothetical protein